MNRSLAIAGLCAALASAPARAWPVNARFELRVGEEKFQRVASDAWLEVESPQVVEAELLPTSEVMLTAKAPGSTLVLVHAEDQVMVWRVVVSGARPERKAADAASKDVLAALNKDCRDAKVEKAELVATIRDDKCRKAMLAMFSAQDDFFAKDLDLTFEVPSLQSQLRDVQSGLSRVGAQVRAAYSGAGLRLEGKATEAQRRKIYWEIFRASVGRLALEDRIETVEGEKSP